LVIFMTGATSMTQTAGDAEPKQGFTSRLDKGRERFLAHAVEHALEVGRRTPEDFIRHFPPELIMEGLASQPRIRANILVLTTGLKQKIATRKSWQSAAEDLRIALDEKETDAESIVTVFSPDDRIRYLDAKKVWQFLIEGEFWKVGGDDKEKHHQAKEHTAFLLERALVDHLVTHADIVEGITVSEIAKRLPKAELGKIIEAALTKSRSKAPFAEVDLLREMPPFVLVEYVPLDHIYDSVIAEKIAIAHDYVAPPEEEAPVSEMGADGDWVEVADGPEDEEEEASDEDFGMS
jgi:hypothetical protein